MLKRLRVKMILLNIGVVALVIVTIMGLQFYSSSRILRRQADMIKSRITSTKADEPRTLENLHNSQVLGNRMIMVAVNSSGKMITVSENQYFPNIEIRQRLYESITGGISDMRYMKLDDRVYFTFNVKKDDVIFYYFLDATQERELNRLIMRNTALIGIAAIVLIIAASIFLTKKALIPVNRAWERQKRFVSDASHELRTPIAVIKTNMEVLGEDDAATVGSQKQWMDNVNEETDRMADLIEKLLFLSRKDITEKVSLPVAVKFSNPVAEAVESLRPIARKKGLDIKLEGDEAKVRIPEGEIKRLSVILIDNAIKYSDSGTISIRTESLEKRAILTVQDEGIGIKSEDIEQVFERFYRVDEARNRLVDGYGLGLSIAGAICGAYNGKISVESEPGKGSKFIVSFPEAK